MKFPSVHTLVQSTLATCRRFPLTILFILTACFFSLRMINFDDQIRDAHYYYYNIIWSAYLGMLLSLIVYIYTERTQSPALKKWFGILGTLVLVVIFYFSLPDHFSEARLIQFILFMAGLHLMVAFIPFTGKNEVNGFWQYNKSLFLRVLTAGLYSIVLYAGLALAILAVENLFSVKVNYRWYADLWLCIFELFSSLFFLAGFPAAFENLESSQDYPKGLKIFTQYVLLPIITVYLVILYAYMFKIIATQNWPFGWVSYLVLAFSVAGILSLLLIYPVRMEANNKWILTFSRFFYFAICPLIVLLFLAIERRISDYGVTEERYIVFGLSCWLGFISLYFIFSKINNIKAIPVSLCILALGISFGPWGIFSVSLQSQKNRLTGYLKSNEMLSPDQKIIPSKTTLKQKDATQIRDIVRYLVEAHGYQSLQPLFSQNLDSLMGKEKDGGNNAYAQSSRLLSVMKVGDDNGYVTASSLDYFRIYPQSADSLLSVSGYEYLLSGYHIINNSDDPQVHLINTADQSIIVLLNNTTGMLSLNISLTDSIKFNLNNLVKTLKKNDFSFSGDNNSFPRKSLMLSGENKDISAKIIIQEITGSGGPEKISIIDITFDLLLHYKKH